MMLITNYHIFSFSFSFSLVVQVKGRGETWKPFLKENQVMESYYKVFFLLFLCCCCCFLGCNLIRLP